MYKSKLSTNMWQLRFTLIKIIKWDKGVISSLCKSLDSRNTSIMNQSSHCLYQYNKHLLIVDVLTDLTRVLTYVF